MLWRGVLAAVVCSASVVAVSPSGLNAQPAPAGQAATSCSDVVKSLAGVWKAPQYKMKRASEVGTQVFGPNSYDIRNVDLTLDASGEGTLKISSSVLDQKGKTWAPTAVEAKLKVAPPAAAQASAAGRCEPAVTVVSAEEKFLDATNYAGPLPGTRVMIVTDAAAKQIDVRFETPKGEGSFWSTLIRQTS